MTSDKPILLVITGRPASGKSTLARQLQTVLQPPANFKLLARDDGKRRYLEENGVSHDQAPDNVNQLVTQIFSEQIFERIQRGQSVLADAAFQQKLWEIVLAPTTSHANIKMIICNVSADAALTRYNARLREQPDWQYLHGADAPYDLIRNYKAPVLDCPTLELDMEGEVLDITSVVEFILS